MDKITGTDLTNNENELNDLKIFKTIMTKKPRQSELDLRFIGTRKAKNLQGTSLNRKQRGARKNYGLE